MGTADGGSIIADACTMERSARKGHAAPLRRQSRQGLRRRAFPTGAERRRRVPRLRLSLSKNHPNGLDSGIRVMDYEWLYDRLTPYYCHDNGRPGTDPVVLIKMVLIQHLSASAFRTS